MDRVLSLDELVVTSDMGAKGTAWQREGRARIDKRTRNKWHDRGLRRVWQGLLQGEGPPHRMSGVIPRRVIDEAILVSRIRIRHLNKKLEALDGPKITTGRSIRAMHD